MLMNCKKCKLLTADYVNKASGLDLHRFNWLKSDKEIGSITGNGWNKLILSDRNNSEFCDDKANLIHWTLGGPWFKEQRNMGGKYASEWFNARDEAMRLWD